jgi:hypothetical protein
MIQSFFSHILLVERDKHDDTRRYDGENHHEINLCHPGEQQPAQAQPQ